MENLPSGKVLYDLFCGGCAVTHAAMLSGKWERVVANDLQADMPRFFLDACNGKYKDEKRWISRDDFYRLKDTDAYVRQCWSFGNNGRDYLYSRNIEPWRKALHFARVLGDCSLLREMGIEGDGSRRDCTRHSEEYRTKYVAWYNTHRGGIVMLKTECMSWTAWRGFRVWRGWRGWRVWRVWRVWRCMAETGAMCR